MKLSQALCALMGSYRGLKVDKTTLKDLSPFQGQLFRWTLGGLKVGPRLYV